MVNILSINRNGDNTTIASFICNPNDLEKKEWQFLITKLLLQFKRDPSHWNNEAIIANIENVNLVFLKNFMNDLQWAD